MDSERVASIRRRRIGTSERNVRSKAWVSSLQPLSFQTDDADLVVRHVNIFQEAPYVAVSYLVASGTINVLLPVKLAYEMGEAMVAASNDMRQHRARKTPLTRRRIGTR
jgi:hypothetical protein